MNRFRDVNVDIWWTLDIPNYMARVLVKKDNTPTPACLNIGIFFFWSLILLSWPYRIWFESLTEAKEITIGKVVKVYSGF